MIYWDLFASFFHVGLFSIGGGMAAMPLVQEQVVTLHGWLTLREFTDLITIAEMTPGPITINSATFVGIRLAGLPGALIATLGSILPGCIITALLYVVYRRCQSLAVVQNVLGGLRPCVVAMIASAGLSILLMALWGGGRGCSPRRCWCCGSGSPAPSGSCWAPAPWAARCTCWCKTAGSFPSVRPPHGAAQAVGKRRRPKDGAGTRERRLRRAALGPG